METYRYTVTDDGKTLSFIDLPENKDFIKALIRAFTAIDLQLTDTADLWINDEISVKAVSNVGEFSIIRNVEGFYFITANDEKQGSMLDVVLSGADGFEKIG